MATHVLCGDRRRSLRHQPLRTGPGWEQRIVIHTPLHKVNHLVREGSSCELRRDRLFAAHLLPFILHQVCVEYTFYIFQSNSFDVPNLTSSAASFLPDHVMVSFCSSNIFKIINLPDRGGMGAIRSTLSSWPLGIMSESEAKGDRDFTLYGHPWQATGRLAVLSQRLICRVFSCLALQVQKLNLNLTVFQATDNVHHF